jgi:ketosteroid isomerase-like protein
MHTNEQLIHTFYTAFQRKDYKTMQQCYADNATFSDAVFVGLNAAQVKAMWEMLCVKSKDLKIEYKILNVTDTIGSTEWIATYSFSATGNKVINRVTADFTFANGKIVTHKDNFNFYTWAKQALGTPGLLLGWTSMLRNKVRAQAAKSLADYMAKK